MSLPLDDCPGTAAGRAVLVPALSLSLGAPWPGQLWAHSPNSGRAGLKEERGTVLTMCCVGEGLGFCELPQSLLSALQIMGASWAETASQHQQELSLMPPLTNNRRQSSAVATWELSYLDLCHPARLVSGVTAPLQFFVSA